MGLTKFIDDQFAQAENPTLRVLLMPSFHPEVCLTFSRDADTASLSTVALSQQFWSKGPEIVLPIEHHRCIRPVGEFESAILLFQGVVAAAAPDKRFAVIDGMDSESCLVSKSGVQRLRMHVSTQTTIAELCAKLIDLAWNACDCPHLRNRLAHAATYLNKKYPFQVETPKQPVTRVAVLGTEEERQDYLEALKRFKPEKR